MNYTHKPSIPGRGWCGLLTSPPGGDSTITPSLSQSNHWYIVNCHRLHVFYCRYPLSRNWNSLPTNAEVRKYCQIVPKVQTYLTCGDLSLEFLAVCIEYVIFSSDGFSISTATLEKYFHPASSALLYIESSKFGIGIKTTPFGFGLRSITPDTAWSNIVDFVALSPFREGVPKTRKRCHMVSKVTRWWYEQSTPLPRHHADIWPTSRYLEFQSKQLSLDPVCIRAYDIDYTGQSVVQHCWFRSTFTMLRVRGLENVPQTRKWLSFGA